MTLRQFLRPLLLTLAMSALAACNSDEERAAKHYQKGVELLEAGDVDRALVEFRNVFKLDGYHRDARALYAQTVMERGKIREAYGQYLRLVEQFPEDLDAQLALAELSIKSQSWESAQEHGALAVALAPDNPRVRAVKIALDYHDALIAEDEPARRAAMDAARALQAATPHNQINQSILIDGLVRDGKLSEAVAEVDRALQSNADDLELYRLRLGLLAELNDQAAVEQQLLQMTSRFPDDETTKATLIRFYMSRQDLDSAEQVLRGQITEGKPDDSPRLTLVQFLARARGTDAAIAELDDLIAEGTNNDRFGALRASLRYTKGERDAAIAEIDQILDDADTSDQTREIMVLQARFLLDSGNEVGARKLVEQVLAQDPSMVEALKLRARWLIESDQADEAIVALRLALDQSPDDAEAMTIMAQAHQRNGSRELAGELLALAADSSNSGVEESLRYARFLLGEGKILPAENILVKSLRLSPNSLPLLTNLGRIYVEMGDWPRAEHVERSLRGLGVQQAEGVANQLKLQILSAQSRDKDALAFLEDLANDKNGALGAQVSVVRAHLTRGDTKSAREYLDTLLAENPDVSIFQYLDATVTAAEGRTKDAQSKYRALLAKDDQQERIWLELIRSHVSENDQTTARAVLDEALRALPEGRDLLWMKASYAERDGDLPAAIAIYEQLYAQNSANSIVANNLASLLATTRTDEDSLARAFNVARRLRGLEFPPYQDTYGWIAYRRGDYDEAVKHLEPAARGMSRDPVVQYHLAMVYDALNRPADAIAQLKKALAVAGDSEKPEIELARAELKRLERTQ